MKSSISRSTSSVGVNIVSVSASVGAFESIEEISLVGEAIAMPANVAKTAMPMKFTARANKDFRSGGVAAI